MLCPSYCLLWFYGDGPVLLYLLLIGLVCLVLCPGVFFGYNLVMLCCPAAFSDSIARAFKNSFLSIVAFLLNLGLIVNTLILGLLSSPAHYAHLSRLKTFHLYHQITRFFRQPFLSIYLPFYLRLQCMTRMTLATSFSVPSSDCEDRHPQIYFYLLCGRTS